MNWRDKRRGVLVSVAVLVAALATCFVVTLSKPEPSYQGQPVSYWISQLGWQVSAGSAFPNNQDAWRAFSQTNREALPFLIAALRAREPARDALLRKLSSVLPRKLGGGFRVRDCHVDEARQMTLTALIMMGANAREAVPVLVDVLGDRRSYLRIQAANVLGNIGMAAADAVPALIRRTRDNDSLMRLAALATLRRIAPGDERVLSAFAVALGDQDKQVRFLAVEHLLERAPPRRAWLDTVVELSRGPEAHDRWRAIELLRKSGPAILDALPALVERLNDENNRVRALAAIVLGEVGPRAEAAAPALTKALADEYANVRQAAAEALTKIVSGKAAPSSQGAP